MKDQKGLLMYSLAGAFVIGFFILLGILTFKEIPKENSGLLNMVIGALLGIVSTIVSYFFGSSKGSADKTSMISTNK